MERNLRAMGETRTGKELMIALGFGLISCLPQILDHVHDTANRMIEEGFALDIRLGGFSLKFGRTE